MRILFVLENYFPHVGGVENGFRSLCEGLAAAGHTVTVLTRQLPKTSPSEMLGGVAIVRIPSADSRYVFTFAAIPHAVRLAHRHDVIHTTTYNGAPPAWLAARLSRRPIVLTVNETWMGHWRTFSNFGRVKSALHELLERAIYALDYDRYVSISHATQRALSTALPRARSRSSVVYYAFDPQPWQAATHAANVRVAHGLEGRYLVLGYGRPGTSKGFEYLVDAFPLMRARLPNVALVLILSRATQYRKEWDALKARADDGVLVLESQPWPTIVDWVRTADCVVVPSLTEGFGYTTLESAAAGRPIVASNTASIPEVIYGRFVLMTPRDPQAIADGVATIAAGGGERKEPRPFTIAQTIDGYLDVYRELTYGRPVRQMPFAERAERGDRP